MTRFTKPPHAVFTLTLIAGSIGMAFAAGPTDLGTVGTQATEGSAAPASRAAVIAPTQTPLEATQPQSIINRSFIEDAKSPASDFTAIAAVAPSVTGGISANGPGLSEAKNGIRGFQDGEYNITWDGIPFGDTNGPTHHSTAYFPAAAVGSVVVDRGPGNASNIGNATFGGTVALHSQELAAEQTITPYLSAGSWGTQLMGIRFDSGTLSGYDDAKLGVNYQKLTSDGYRTRSAIQSENFNGKLQVPLGDSTLLTLNFNANRNWYYQNDKESGVTLAQAALLGKNYALGTDPAKANYYGYNLVHKTTAMNYARLQSDLGNGWAIDNTAYYYNYTNHGLSASATDLTAGLSSVKSSTGATIANQMAGYLKINEYWVAGDIFKTTKQFETGLLRVGFWTEKADTHRALYDYNLLNGQNDYRETAVPGSIAGINNVKYEQNSGWTQTQPFAEFEWLVSPELTVTPGLKYMSDKLNIDASVNQTARLRQQIDKKYTASLPFLTANYKLNPQWSAYAQYAEGMLVPDISNYQSSNANATDIKPQTSKNYQAGVVHKSDALAFDADVYYIDFNNKFAVLPSSPASNPIYYNQGGVEYKGIEADVTYVVGGGFSVYANASLNRAESKTTHLQVAGVPDTTSALGLLYKDGGWSGSLMYKRVGRTFALDDQGYEMNPVSSADLNVAYTFTDIGLGAKRIKLQLGIFNLTDKQDAIAVKAKNTTVGAANYGTPAAGDTFFFQPERNVMLSAKAEF